MNKRLLLVVCSIRKIHFRVEPLYGFCGRYKILSDGNYRNV